MWANSTMVFKNCDPNNDITFKYGIFEDVLVNSVVSLHFVENYYYCLWWGLQQLNSYGQILSTSLFLGETSFSILISSMGLVLFAYLIGNMQVLGKGFILESLFRLPNIPSISYCET